MPETGSTRLLDVRTEVDLGCALPVAAAVLRAGGLVAFPTETVYGLGANALDAAAVDRIFAAKGRPATNPVIVHVSEVEQAKALVAAWPAAADELAARFWPGPLTLVLPRVKAVPDVVTAGGPTVAVRVPAHPVALALLRQTGLPLAAPSANRSMRLSPTTAEHVLRDLGGRVDVVLDGGPTPGGIESTVIDVSGPPRLLRPGLIDVPALEAVVGPLARAMVTDGQPLPSPGLMARHYAPRTPLEAVADGLRRAAELHAAGLRVALVSHLGDVSVPSGVVVRAMPAEPAAYARALYAALHDLDRENLDRIVVALPPAGEEWLAVRDRLARAATPG